MKIVQLLLITLFISGSAQSQEVDKKSVFLSMYKSLSGWKDLINTRYRNKQSLNQIGVDLGCGENLQKIGQVSWCRVSATGEIYGFNAEHGVVVYLVPETHFDYLTWRCFGYPAEALSAGCELEKTGQMGGKKW